MHAVRIDFRGFQRLANTGCNTDAPMIAFLGPNEAGKSTLLRALDWFSNGEGELPPEAFNAATPPNGSAVVRVRYWLDADDLKALDGLPIAPQPQSFELSRMEDGGLRASAKPKVRRDAAPFERAKDLLEKRTLDPNASLQGDISYDQSNPNKDPDHTPRITPLLEVVNHVLDSTEAQWNDEWDQAWDEFVAYLRQAVEPSGEDDEEKIDPHDIELADALEQVKAVLSASHPEEQVRARLHKRVPKFALFSRYDRELQSVYDLEDPDLITETPKALANLAWVAELDLDKLAVAITNNVLRTIQSTERRANERLKERLGPRWSQKGLDVRLNVSGSTVQVVINEHAEDGADTPIGERSDGLKMFVALVAFLARRNFDIPPILLIDEAETHLHYDAQADLLEVLTNDVDATQVFYTTHSPGCLPRDLGTGVRLVAPDPKRSDASTLRNDFWTSKGTGFTPLLFAMGASAAAFSAFRRAVLTEGPSDMLLLPSLIRTATGAKQLDYQVVPGLANYRGSGLELEEVAARVAYLVDGDQGGTERADMLTDMGIDATRIKQHPDGFACEDYIHPDDYLSVINDLVHLGNPELTVSAADLDLKKPISSAVTEWCETNNIKAFGKPLVATQLLNRDGPMRLADGAAPLLQTLHSEITAALVSMPAKSSNQTS